MNIEMSDYDEWVFNLIGYVDEKMGINLTPFDHEIFMPYFKEGMTPEKAAKEHYYEKED